MQHRNDVQGLRAVAIAAVLAFHFFPELFPNGFLGVDIFFVISGYLIMMILSRSTAKAGGVSVSLVGSFYYRRVKRILPLHLLYCFVAIVLFTFIASPSIIKDSRKSAATALGFVTNIYALFDQNTYFERVLDENLFTHIWSLSVEMQFYLIVPLFFAMRSPGAGGRILLPAVGALSLFFHLNTPPLVAFNVVFARLWQFFATSLFEDRLLKEAENKPSLPSNTKDDLHERLLENGDASEDEAVLRPPRPSAARMLAEQGVYLTAMVTLFVVPLWTWTLPPAEARVAVTMAAAVVIALGRDASFSRILGASPLEFLGDISYSLYLIHWPFAVYLVKETAIFSRVRLTTIPMALLLTLVVYYLFERRYRQWSEKQIGWSCLSFFLLSVCALIISPIINERLNRADISVAEAIRQNEYVFAHQDENLNIKECHYKLWRNMSGPQHQGYITGHHGICEMPPGKGKLKFVVIGNSFAPNQADLVWRQFKPFFGNFTTFSQTSCEVLAYTHSSFCKHFANYTDVLDELKADVVFIIQCYTAIKNPLPPAGNTTDPPYEEMVAHLKAIENKASLFFIMDSYPWVSGKMHQLNDMIRKNVSAEEINESITLRKEDIPARVRTKKLAAQCKNCILYDVAPGLRDKEGRFIAYDGETHLALFERTSHLTPAGRRRIEPYYAELSRTYATRLRELEQRLYPD